METSSEQSSKWALFRKQSRDLQLFTVLFQVVRTNYYSMDASDIKSNNLQTSSSTLKSPRRTISVQSVGEVRCPPNVIQFGMSVCSTKETLEAAQASVKRRTDYILQVLRNNGIKEKSSKCSTDIFRKDDECVRVQTDVIVECDGVSKCETIRNLLIEKLDSSSVQLTPVSFHHLAESKEEKRQEAFKRAVANARSKAQSVSQTVGVQLGPALEVIEMSQDSPDSMMDMQQESTHTEMLPDSLHVRFAKETLVYRSQVSVVFESQPLRMCTHKKCKNH